MRACEYCGLNTDTRESNCPSCNAPLPPLPVRQPQPPPSPVTYSSVQVHDARGPARVITAIVLGVIIIIGAIAAALSQADKKPPASKSAPPYEAPVSVSAAETAKTVSGLLTNPALRQIVEQYFGKEAGKLTLDDLATIQFLYLQGETAYLSDQPLGLPGTYEPDVDLSLTTAVAFDGYWPGCSSLDCLSGLKTLVFKGVGAAAEDIPALPELERLAIYSGTNSTDFAGFTKFPKLRELFISGGGVVSLNGLSDIPGLEKLGLFSTGLTDLGLLSQMTTLKGLTLSDNDKMQGLQTLESMTWLKELVIDSVDFYDLNFIAKMPRLERLTVSDTPTISLSFLSGLTELKYLHLTDNSEIKAIPSLSAMTKLEEIYLDCSLTSDEALDDAAFLNGLSSVKKATLFEPNSLEPLWDFTSLEYLHLSLGWRVEDISPLGSASVWARVSAAHFRSRCPALRACLM